MSYNHCEKPLVTLKKHEPHHLMHEKPFVFSLLYFQLFNQGNRNNGRPKRKRQRLVNVPRGVRLINETNTTMPILQHLRLLQSSLCSDNSFDAKIFFNNKLTITRFLEAISTPLSPRRCAAHYIDRSFGLLAPHRSGYSVVPQRMTNYDALRYLYLIIVLSPIFKDKQRGQARREGGVGRIRVRGGRPPQ